MLSIRPPYPALRIPLWQLRPPHRRPLPTVHVRVLKPTAHAHERASAPQPRRTRQDETPLGERPRASGAYRTRRGCARNGRGRNGTRGAQEDRSRGIGRHLRRRGPTAGKDLTSAETRRRGNGPAASEQSLKGVHSGVRRPRKLPETSGNFGEHPETSYTSVTNARIDGACSARAAPGRASFIAASLGTRGACYRARAEATRRGEAPLELRGIGERNRLKPNR